MLGRGTWPAGWGYRGIGGARGTAARAKNWSGGATATRREGPATRAGWDGQLNTAPLPPFSGQGAKTGAQEDAMASTEG